ncbi:hypothetical protein [Janibacter melonis]|uniref:hypothetical protein n=1 Tax=Janibacter melonis TaxID=262209 RepID=UPI00174D5D45|nr:hypothetical protein [Janibacter melonis]
MTKPDLDLSDVRALVDEEADHARRDMPPFASISDAAHSRRLRTKGAALGAALCAAAVAVGVAVAWGSGTQQTSPATSSTPTAAVRLDTSRLPDHPRVDQVADSIASALGHLGRDGGGTWISEHKTLNIYVAGPSKGMDQVVVEIQRQADEVTRSTDFEVKVHAGGVRTQDQLVKIMDKVSDTSSYDSDGVVTVRGQRINYSSGRVSVEVTSQPAADVVKRTFGDAVEVQVKPPWTQEELEEMFGMPGIAPPGSLSQQSTASSTSRR